MSVLDTLNLNRARLLRELASALEAETTSAIPSSVSADVVAKLKRIIRDQKQELGRLSLLISRFYRDRDAAQGVLVRMDSDGVKAKLGAVEKRLFDARTENRSLRYELAKSQENLRSEKRAREALQLTVDNLQNDLESDSKISVLDHERAMKERPSCCSRCGKNDDLTICPECVTTVDRENLEEERKQFFELRAELEEMKTYKDRLEEALSDRDRALLAARSHLAHVNTQKQKLEGLLHKHAEESIAVLVDCAATFPADKTV